MVLDFGSGSLFKPSGLEQDTGLLKDRWGQDGSTIVNISTYVDNSDPTVTLYTVTAGKRLYINTIVLSDSSGDIIILLKDGGVGGVQKFSLRNITADDAALPINLPTPIYFDTDIYCDGTGLTNMLVNLYGWEERA